MSMQSYQTSVALMRAQARILIKNEEHSQRIASRAIPIMQELRDELNVQASVEPTIDKSQLFKPVKELFIAGGGGAGRALPSAFEEAVKHGLDLDNLEVICATSVGTIIGLGIVLGITPSEMRVMLNEMPTHQFQDWSLKKIYNFFTEWGLCSGKVINNYLLKMIYDKTGLIDPTFLELYEAGYTKEFRVVTTNVSKLRPAIFSHKLTPHKKVSDMVTAACSFPIVFAPHWIVNEQGVLECHSDGGLLRNYPFGFGGDATIPLEQQLGFNFVNKGAAYALDNDRHTLIDTFWQYFTRLLSMIMFQDPLSLPENVKDRTVVINVNHNPLNFDATPEQQQALDLAGIQGVQRLAQKIEDNGKLKSKPKSFSAPALLTAFEHARTVKQSSQPLHAQENLLRPSMRL